jgi:hypothetical protein
MLGRCWAERRRTPSYATDTTARDRMALCALTCVYAH